MIKIQELRFKAESLDGYYPLRTANLVLIINGLEVNLAFQTVALRNQALQELDS